MVRVKVNDYYEFPHQLDMKPYTQEFLAAKEKEREFVSSLPDDYYNFELIGIVVHMGTADSGHYYSFIKEQEVFERVDREADPEKWMEFNDIMVSDFDPKDIPQQCFGGEEVFNYGWQQSKMQNFRNAYLLLYKRKYQQDVKIDEEESSAVAAKASKLGLTQLELPPES